MQRYHSYVSSSKHVQNSQILIDLNARRIGPRRSRPQRPTSRPLAPPPTAPSRRAGPIRRRTRATGSTGHPRTICQRAAWPRRGRHRMEIAARARKAIDYTEMASVHLCICGSLRRMPRLQSTAPNATARPQDTSRANARACAQTRNNVCTRDARAPTRAFGAVHGGGLRAEQPRLVLAHRRRHRGGGPDQAGHGHLGRGNCRGPL